MDGMIRSRRGVALGLTLTSMVIIGVIVAGVLFVATQDYRIAGNTVRQTRAAAAAELGLTRARVEWNSSYNTKLATGDTVHRVYALGNGGSANVVVTRLAGGYLFAAAEGRAGSGSRAVARRRYGAMWRLDNPNIPFMGALTGRGNILVGGSATVTGKDITPSGWTGCGPTKNVAGIAMSDTTAGLKLPGCSVSKNCVDGDPKFVQTTLAADTSTYFVYGNMTYTELAANATTRITGPTTLPSIGPIALAGVCAKQFSQNWGDPTRAFPIQGACEGYFPVIHITGDAQITGGKGQGILLVDGDLKLSGGFTFAGIIIARGTLSSVGTGAKITGGVLAANISLDADNTVLGNSSIQYSSCVIQQAMIGSALPVPVRDRSWMTLY